MINEANRVFSHQELIDAMVDHLQRQGLAVYTEVPLPNRKIADIVYLTSNGGIAIIEAKTDYRGYYLPQAYDKYASYCHYLILVIPNGDPLSKYIPAPMTTWREHGDEIGVTAVDAAGVGVIRSPQVRTLPQARATSMRSYLLSRLAAGGLTPRNLPAPPEAPRNKKDGSP